jgi:copper chaperone CopZ
MEKIVLTIPLMYGDHHTSAVRSILEQIEGIKDVYASSSSHSVSLKYDPKVVKQEVIEKTLTDEGYSTEDLEQTYAMSVTDRTTRHTAARAGTGDTLAFAEGAPSWQGRPLWPCPGFEIKPIPEDE